ncbi:hypothetical protein [Streptomyces sp. NPDC005141]
MKIILCLTVEVSGGQRMRTILRLSPLAFHLLELEAVHRPPALAGRELGKGLVVVLLRADAQGDDFLVVAAQAVDFAFRRFPTGVDRPQKRSMNTV